MRRRMLFSGESKETISLHECCNIISAEDGLNVTWTSDNNVVEYCINNDGIWRELNSGETTQTVNNESIISFKIKGTPVINEPDYVYNSHNCTGVGNLQVNNKKFHIYGSVMSLTKNNNISRYYFCNLFSGTGNNQLLSIDNLFLPATTLAEGCYAYMFADRDLYTNTSYYTDIVKYKNRQDPFSECEITDYDENFLPAAILADYCYYGMFSRSNWYNIPKITDGFLATGCCAYMFEDCKIGIRSHYINSSDDQKYKLDSIFLADYCYEGMFKGATIRFKVILPATTLKLGCYSSMFCDTNTFLYDDSSNTVLVYPVDELPATTVAGSCYKDMFANIYAYGNYSNQYLKTTTITLPAKTVGISSYAGMFSGCSSLTTAPSLPATTVDGQCYYGMFSGCSSLTTTPSLPATTADIGSYAYMFEGCTSLKTAPSLPATTVDDSSYAHMFSGCSSLTTAPSLPATTIGSYCYAHMFEGCSSLKTAPSLPATTAKYYCYEGMFSGCSSLTTAPSLPATTVAENCYSGMFSGCSSLTTAPSLPATTVASHCYSYMFEDCSSLTTAPSLPATKVEFASYRGMFEDCSSLTTAPSLPATTVARDCYSNMFSGCSSLKTAPSILPAMDLWPDCYSYMFKGCSSLTTAPELPAETLDTDCYRQLFYNCSSLNYIKAMFTTNYSNNPDTDDWVYGVASNGTFVKNSNATWNITGVDGVPSGWTVQTTTS